MKNDASYDFMKDEFAYLRANISDIQKRLTALEIKIDLIKSIFTHWKFWTALIILIAIIDHEWIIHLIKKIGASTGIL